MITKHVIETAIRENCGVIDIAGNLVSIGTVREKLSATTRGKKYWVVNLRGESTSHTNFISVVNHLYEKLNEVNK